VVVVAELVFQEVLQAVLQVQAVQAAVENITIIPVLLAQELLGKVLLAELVV
jgi:hypothetical protein